MVKVNLISAIITALSALSAATFATTPFTIPKNIRLKPNGAHKNWQVVNSSPFVAARNLEMFHKDCSSARDGYGGADFFYDAHQQMIIYDIGPGDVRILYLEPTGDDGVYLARLGPVPHNPNAIFRFNKAIGNDGTVFIDGLWWMACEEMSRGYFKLHASPNRMVRDLSDGCLDNFRMLLVSSHEPWV